MSIQEEVLKVFIEDLRENKRGLPQDEIDVFLSLPKNEQLQFLEKLRNKLIKSFTDK